MLTFKRLQYPHCLTIEEYKKAEADIKEIENITEKLREKFEETWGRLYTGPGTNMPAKSCRSITRRSYKLRKYLDEKYYMNGYPLPSPFGTFKQKYDEDVPE